MHTLLIQLVEEEMTFTQAITFGRNHVILLLLEKHARKGVFCFLVDYYASDCHMLAVQSDIMSK